MIHYVYIHYAPVTKNYLWMVSFVLLAISAFARRSTSVENPTIWEATRQGPGKKLLLI
ncbi:MAG: hypothetical protein [Olavius algarvensis Delta 4 endosymbiont]|nr:MAG: hypothetical protein [Olavius algarvensis Delta 4 endosymbiont]